MRLSVVIPCYNGADKIIGTIKSLKDYFSFQDYDYEVLIVNDGSTDNTAQAVSKEISGMPNFRLIDNSSNCGKGCVVKQGMLEAKGDWRLFMDDDSSTTIDHLDKFWPYAEKNYDVIIASIAAKGATVAKVEKPHRRLFGKLGNLWIQFWVLPGIWDSQRGFKMLSSRASEKVFPLLKMNRWSFDIEILALARKFKFKIKEVPIHWVNEGVSRVKISAYIQVFIDVLKIRWGLWTGKYKVNK